MKTLLLFFSSIICLQATAQWTDTNDKFYDSLVMHVTDEPKDQKFVVIQETFPDSGYILIWNDTRENKLQIYAQKYDKDGKQLWANNGVLVANSSYNQHLDYSTNEDLRNYSITATDSAGGCYVAYTDDSAGNRMMVQHIRPNGTMVFPDEGFVYSRGTVDYSVGWPQLIADGNKGVFVGFLKTTRYSEVDLYVACYRDENGTMKYYGGGIMDENAYYAPVDCTPEDVKFRDAHVNGYHLFPDLQKGCVVLMSIAESGIGQPNAYIGLNKLVRIKKDCSVNQTWHMVWPHVIDTTTSHIVTTYKKDSVMVMFDFFQVCKGAACGAPNGGVYEFTSCKMISNGLLHVTDHFIAVDYVKGATLATDGDINIISCAFLESDNNGWVLKSISLPDEKYDSIPYGFTVGESLSPYHPAFTTSPFTATVNIGLDTLMKSPAYEYNFALRGTGDKVYLAARVPTNDQPVIQTNVLSLRRVNNDSFSLTPIRIDKSPLTLGQNVSTGFGGTSISYYNPQIAVGADGTAVFYVYEYGRYVRVSPLDELGNVTWQPMGTPIGYGSNNQSLPVLAVNPFGGKGLAAWNAYTANYEDIWMRHLDNLFTPGYSISPLKVQKLLGNEGVTSLVNNFLGTAGLWNYFMDFKPNSTLAAIKDDYRLGSFPVLVYENHNTLRLYNNKPYLDRNFTIEPPNKPPSGTPIKVRLYFTEESLQALKTADPSITDPGMLSVAKQPHTLSANVVPDKFNPTSAVQEIIPDGWGTVPDGGYFLEITVNGFSDFFIQKMNGPLPVTSIDITAIRTDPNNAKVNWRVTGQSNIRDYTLEQGSDGSSFKSVCMQSPDPSEMYNCIVAADAGMIWYFRVKETDLDGKSTYSKIVKLNPAADDGISIYPNPATSIIHVFGALNSAEYSISDMSGKTMLKGKVKSDGQIVITALNKGFYTLCITDMASGRKSFKIIKN